MDKPLLGERLAVLAANGFEERDLFEMQRTIQPLGGAARIIGLDQGLVNGWNEDGWGLNYAVDKVLSAALAVDYSMLILPGGERSIAKLESTAHSRRFIKGFIDSGKPVVVVGGAVELLTFADRLSGRTVAVDETRAESVEAAGGTPALEPFVVDGNLMSVRSADDVNASRSAISKFIVSQFTVYEAA